MTSTILSCLRRAAAVVRTVVGAPDYERYVAHVRAHHPGTEPLGWAEFYRSRLEDRYARPGSRCC
jgi:uncharacterized short protein YbdD (DUF466 family)